ncbi:hypothetical protein PC120_g24944 [Phytophthora cactorum]|nr:hypothetical protein PC120_g24944 [Phytophthora cactorum]
MTDNLNVDAPANAAHRLHSRWSVQPSLHRLPSAFPRLPPWRLEDQGPSSHSLPLARSLVPDPLSHS